MALSIIHYRRKDGNCKCMINYNQTITAERDGEEIQLDECKLMDRNCASQCENCTEYICFNFIKKFRMKSLEGFRYIKEKSTGVKKIIAGRIEDCPKTISDIFKIILLISTFGALYYFFDNTEKVYNAFISLY